MQEHSKQIKAGRTPKEVEIPTKVGPLRDATVPAVEHVWDWLTTDDGRRIVRRAWERCEAGEWNLGLKSLTSRKATKALIEYLRTHPGLYEEIKNRVGDVGAVADLEHEESEEAELNDFGDPDDHTDVPMQALVREVLDLDIEGGDGTALMPCVDLAHAKSTPEGAMRADAPSEDISAYRDDGVGWQDALAEDEGKSELEEEESEEDESEED